MVLLVDNRGVGGVVCTCKRKKRGSRVYPTDKLGLFFCRALGDSRARKVT
jgi:hypothetical protein